jgi:hypothetical protein
LGGEILKRILNGDEERVYLEFGIGFERSVLLYDM